MHSFKYGPIAPIFRQYETKTNSSFDILRVNSADFLPHRWSRIQRTPQQIFEI